MSQLVNASPTFKNEVSESGLEKAAITDIPNKVLDAKRVKKSRAGKTHLYKHYGQGRKLLYVGISLSALQRLIQHRKSAEWFDEIQTIVVKRYDTRKAALAAEARLIAKHQPRFNHHHQPWSIALHIAKKFGNYENWRLYADDLDRGMDSKAAYELAKVRRDALAAGTSWTEIVADLVCFQ